MKTILSIFIYIPLLAQASIVKVFNDYNETSNNKKFNSPIIYEYEAFERKVNNEDIRRIQIALRSKGFYRGPIDSKMSFTTKRAINRFQSTKGIFIRDIITKEIFSLIIQKRQSTIASN